MAEKYTSLEKELFTYENQYQQHLQTKVPVFIKIKGKAFGTFTKGFQKPYDQIFAAAMHRTMKALCESVQGCVFGYAAADEIILIVTDYKHWNSVPWLNYDTALMNSTIAATASFEFNNAFHDELSKAKENDTITDYSAYDVAAQSYAILTSRCFNVPEERVCDIMFWLQCDNRRNAIQKLARLHIDRKTLIGMCNDEIIEMLKIDHDVDWGNTPSAFQVGVACAKSFKDTLQKSIWEIDTSMPMLNDENRAYLSNILSAIRED